MGVLVEQIAARTLREWLLAKLPAKVTEVNLLRAPVLKSSLLGPFNVPAAKSLQLSTAGIDGPFTAYALTAGGARTAAQVAADINGITPGFASADSDGRLVLTGAAPSAAQKVVSLGKETTAGINNVFGWNSGGERCVRAPLVAPLGTGVADGMPMVADMGPGFWVIIGKRVSVPVPPDVRRDEYQVGLELLIMSRDANVQPNRDRDHIHSTVRCVREVLLTDAGRQLGRAGVGDIVKVSEKTCAIEGVPFSFTDKNAPSGLFDRAFLNLSIRVYERPAAT